MIKLFTSLVARVRRAFAILQTYAIDHPAQQFADLLAGGKSLWRIVGRPIQLYVRVVRAFRRAGATWTEALNMPFAVPAMLGGSTWITDLKNSVIGGYALKIAAYTTSQTGNAVDMVQGFGNLFGIFVLGTQTDATVTGKLTESDTSGGSYTDVAGGSFGTLVTAGNNDDTFVIITARRTLRWIKAATVVSGATSGGIYGVLVLQMKKDG